MADNIKNQKIFKSLNFSTSMENTDDFGNAIKEFVTDASIEKFNNNFFQIAPYLQKVVHIYTEDNTVNENSSDSKLGTPFSFELLLSFLRSKQLQKLKKLNLTNVFISKSHLNQLTEYLTKLKSLSLKKCRLDDGNNIFESNDWKFPELTELNLHGNFINKFTIEILNFPLLSTLDLSYNALRSINFNDYNCEIKILHLQDNNFTEFPKEILCLQNLEVLDLSKNKLEVIPPEIEKLQALLSLDLSKNRLKVLPNNLTKLSCLSKLYLAENHLTKLPPLKTLTALKELDISDNKINSLLSDISILEGCNLIKLSASSNDISCVSHSYTSGVNTTVVGKSFLSTLQYLNLSHNRIASVSFLAGAVALVEIDLSRNSLSSFYLTGNNEFPCLEIINLSHNTFSTILSGLFNIITLKKVDLSYNNLLKLENIENLIYLEHLDISCNKITSFPPLIQNREYLKTIIAKNNCISNIPTFFKEMRSLTYFDIENNPIDEKNTSTLEMIAYIYDLNGGNATNVYTSKTTNHELDNADKTNNFQTGFQKQAQFVNNYVNNSRDIDRINKEKMDAFRRADDNSDDQFKVLDIINKQYPNLTQEHKADPSRPNTPLRLDQIYDDKDYSIDSPNVHSILANKIISHYQKRTDIIIIKENHVKAIRDFINANPHQLSWAELNEVIKNSVFLGEKAKLSLLVSCNDQRPIDSLGKSFMEILQHVFFYVTSQDTFKSSRLFKDIKFHIDYYFNTSTPEVAKYIECIINGMNGLCDEITDNVSDIENVISMTLEVSRLPATMEIKQKKLKEKFAKEMYDETCYSLCRNFIKVTS